MARVNINISQPNDGQGDPLRKAFDEVNKMFIELYNGVVFKENGKGLSSNDFTTLLAEKLDGIESEAQKNVQADLAEEDTESDAFVRNKDSYFGGGIAPQVEIYAGVNTFTLPVGARVSSVLLVRTPLWAGDEYTQTDNTLTITKTMNTGNRIQINFY
jgi:hypothetical protein